jgi:hypothetical protein
MVIHYAQTLPAESRTVLTTAAPKYRALSLEGLVVAAAAAAEAAAEAAPSLDARVAALLTRMASTPSIRGAFLR